MSRFARIVLPGYPYHVTHRGNRGGDVFFGDADRLDYLADLARCAEDAALAIWGYCLMTNHVHLIAVPAEEDALARAIGRAHMRHALRVNGRQGWKGHLWANRYYSTPLDEEHLWTAIKYVELNPARAGLIDNPVRWRWSSAGAHARNSRADPLLAPDRPFGGQRPHPLTGRPIGWGEWLALGLEEEARDRLRRATMTGRPCGSERFVRTMEDLTGRLLTAAPRGRPARASLSPDKP
jgi:putative transposase